MLLDDLKDRRGYCHLKEEALDRTMWRNGFGGGFGPVVRQNIEWMNHHRHKHHGFDPLIRSVNRVTTALTNVSSVFQLFSFLVVCSGMI